jgi:hypothetical protein
MVTDVLQRENVDVLKLSTRIGKEIVVIYVKNTLQMMET